ncbi:DMT family transporter [Photorhabdus aegyptia]|uniref:DMT family transporter n=1 Tax=Photorhabdus aegyptia TaxID=2805098 RepID=UPI001E5FC19A|nr:DMT family transporter [Photorhabdus aegyptia]MCC8460039.1 DMT family transporter [Photorhabdus aegyptia]
MAIFTNNKITANAYGLSSGVFWGLSGVLFALLLKNTALSCCLFIPIVLAFLNDMISCGYMFIYLMVKGKYRAICLIPKNKKNGIIILAAIFGGPIGMSCYILAIQYIGISYTATISATYPAIGALISFFLLKDRIHLIGILGLILAVVCTMILGYSASTQTISGWIGFLFAFICALGWSSEVVISSYGMNKDIPADIAYFIRQLSSSVGYLVIIILFIHPFPSIVNIFSNTGLYSLLFFTSLVATLSYLFYYKAICMLQPIRAMSLNITYAIWAVIFACLLVDEPISIKLVLLCVGVSAGSFLTAVNPLNIKKLILTLK